MTVIIAVVAVVIMLILVPIIYAGQYYCFSAKQLRYDDDGQRLYSSAKYVKATRIAAAVFYGITATVGASLSCADVGVTATLVPTVILFVITLIGACDALRVKFDHVLMDDDGITLIRIYRKDKHIRYADIAYYVASSIMLRRNRLNCEDIVYECYDGDNNKILVVNAGFEQIGTFTDKMTELGVALSDYPQIPIRDRREVGLSAACVCLAVCAVCFFGIFALLFATSQTRAFQNTSVRGTVERCYVERGKYDKLIIKLKNDDDSYVVPNAFIGLIDRTVTDALTDGTHITMLIAYRNDRGEQVVSQIEFDGKIYLYASAAQAETQSNDDIGRVTSYIMLAAGIGFLVASVAVGIKAKTTKKRAE